MSRKEKLTNFDRLVLFTLSYSSLFQFALMAEEILDRLPVTDDFDFLLNKKKKDDGKKIIKNLNKIKKSLKKLVVLKFIKEEGDFYFLKANDLRSRKQREKFIKSKFSEAQEFIFLAEKLPFVQAVYLTGSAAVNNADKNDDLDFLIVCQHDTLWISRFILILLTKLRGKRPQLDAERKTVEDTKDAWCLNLWLDESYLKIPKKRRSLYEVYELMQMKLLYKKKEYVGDILANNNWVNKYLDLKNSNKKIKTNKSVFILSVLNKILFILQKTYRSLFFNDYGFLVSLHQAYLNDSGFKDKLLEKLDERFIY